jgi:hypothetical protein
MSEGHGKISTLVFSVTTVLLFGFLLLTASQAFADNRYKGKDKHKEWQKQKEQDTYGRRDYKKGNDYHMHPGYRECPYDKCRQYRYYDYRGHRYDYHGHWRSWDQWDSYSRKHPNLYKHGRYYREEGHLMFRFCDPDTGNCFFFSIGR